MRLDGASVLAAVAALGLAGSAGAALYFIPRGAPATTQSRVRGADPPLLPKEREQSNQEQRVMLAAGEVGALSARNNSSMEVLAKTPVSQGEPPATEQLAPAEAPAIQSSEVEDDGGVTPTLEGRMKGPPGKRGLVILQIGDSHTSADFLTGELRRRLQARYGRGAPGYITAGHPHIGVRSSSLKITTSPGWTYRSLQRPDAVPAQFWLSGYDAIATAPGETLTFASPQPQTFDMIEIEALRQPEGGKIDVKLDGVVETRYDLDARDTEPVVIRLLPIRAATE